jgi:hypothetical protein
MQSLQGITIWLRISTSKVLRMHPGFFLLLTVEGERRIVKQKKEKRPDVLGIFQLIQMLKEAIKNAKISWALLILQEWLAPVILLLRRQRSGGSWFEDSLGQIVFKTLFQKYPTQNKAGGVTQVDRVPA